MKGRLIKFLLTALAAILIIVLALTFGGEKREEGEAFFYTYDSHGRVLNAHQSESDGNWYLFVTSSDSFENIELYCKEEITEASSGDIEDKNKLSSAFKHSDTVSIRTSGNENLTVRLLKSELPSIYIDLTEISLNDLHKDKNVIYSGNSIYVTDSQGEYSISLKNAVQIKGRGNSTWTFYDKKGYQLKFSENISLLGMDEAKDWILLANAGDDSLMRSKLVYDMAEKLGMAFTPSFEYADLWIDGDYRGTYLVGEKVEIASNKLNLKDAKGCIFEHDEGFYMENEHWFFNEMLQRHFSVKDIVKKNETLINESIEDFNGSVTALCSCLYTTPVSEVTLEELSKFIDVDSFIKYYLVNEYVLNRESFVSSFYWYKDGADDVLHLGPIWDFDTSMGNDLTLYYENYGSDHILFKYLLSGKEFYNRTLEIYEVYKGVFISMAENALKLKDEISDSAEMNYLRWNYLGKPNPKGGADYSITFDEAVINIKTWLENRAEAFKIENCNAVTSKVSDDCYEMQISFEDKLDNEHIRFAIWSLENGTDDINWYNAVKDSNGIWRSKVDLTLHNSGGMYRIAVYGDDMSGALTAGYSYVETARKPLCEMNTDVSKDGKTVEIRMSDSELYSEMRFAVWGETNAQDDLAWYKAERDKYGFWFASFKLADHPGSPIYIHAYTKVNGEEKFVLSKIIDVE